MMILTIVCLSINAQINLTTKDTSICQGEYVHLNAQLFFIDGSWYDINGVGILHNKLYKNI